MSTVLTTAGLTVHFDDGTALENVNLSLEGGEALAIIGPNGAGKTVFLRALLGMVPYTGTVTWASGVRVGYVPQKIDADRHLPINVQNLLHAKAATLGLQKKDVDAVVAAVGLNEKTLATPVGHLSGGQFQRALITFALLGQPNVLMLDEPTASIDKPGEEQIYELIHRLQEKYKMTVILVSHELSLIYRYATKVLCLNKTGICFGTPEEAFTPQVLTRLYGTPMKPYLHRAHQNG
jgi:zinc transport system ATP-binding protein